MTKYWVINFYKFIELSKTDIERLSNEHGNVCDKLGLKGSITFSPEGLNAGLSSTAWENIEDYLRFLYQDERFADITYHESVGESKPFAYFRIKRKKHILIFDSDLSPNVNEIHQGKRLSPQKFEKITEEKPEDVVILDTRNYFEVDYGIFKNAESLGITKFRDFPKAFLDRYSDQKDKTFVMYCTGGIRCEKAVAFAEKAGFRNCYQLDGGIMKYHAERGTGTFQGNNFVFDQRWALGSDLSQSADGAHPDRI